MGLISISLIPDADLKITQVFYIPFAILVSMESKEKKKEKKDPFEQIMEILDSYEEGLPPRSTVEYEN